MISSPDDNFNFWRLPLMICGIIFLGLGGLLMLTNPSQQQYEEFATEQLVIQMKEKVCQSNSSNLGEAIKSQICNLMLDTGKKQIPKLIGETTQRHNYLLLSVYETKLYLYSVETLGIFNHFYIIGFNKLYDEK
jgi:hypothetical protein